jgi:hypothetical protein
LEPDKLGKVHLATHSEIEDPERPNISLNFREKNLNIPDVSYGTGVLHIMDAEQLGKKSFSEQYSTSTGTG